jgi:hypothetical protein
LIWKDAQHGFNCSASDSCQSQSKFCHRILMYNKTSGYSTKDTMKALDDVCEAVQHLLKVLWLSTHFFSSSSHCVSAYAALHTNYMCGSCVHVTAIAAVANGLWHHRMMFDEFDVENEHLLPFLFCTQAEPLLHISHFVISRLRRSLLALMEALPQTSCFLTMAQQRCFW